VNDDQIKETYSVEVTRDPVSGKVLTECWHNSVGQRSRRGDMPAEIEYCPETGSQIAMRWLSKDKLHREGDKPAFIVVDPDSGTHLIEHYIVMGIEHRDGDKPTYIDRNANGRVVELQFHKNGHLHRLNAPAHEEFDPETGASVYREFWVEGQEIIPNSSYKFPEPN